MNLSMMETKTERPFKHKREDDKYRKMSLQRFKLTMQYCGTPFSGCVRQHGEITTVQSVLENALAHLTQSPPQVVFSSRTDKGVHAFGQVAHIDLAPRNSGLMWCESSVKGALNHFSRPYPVHILEARAVDPIMFSARRNAYSRTYVYRIFANCKDPILFEQQNSWNIPVALDVTKMQEAANHLLGTHDFTSFRSRGCQVFFSTKLLFNDDRLSRIPIL
eukprot:TRINITY_DN7677_c0_g1_i1.p1 TRINITY_DN7677_c0_g1~~TRINITY_DN7677_c0_g1_i1.p1  ORF type:complete len:219 (-),score=26.30 TRINITY_DN7677_c0_g1_i1:875-1531(-)